MVGKMTMISSRFISCWLHDLCVKTLFAKELSKGAGIIGYWLGLDNKLTPEVVTEALTVQVRVTFLSLKSPENHHVG